jgi:hypothetical protein
VVRGDSQEKVESYEAEPNKTTFTERSNLTWTLRVFWPSSLMSSYGSPDVMPEIKKERRINKISKVTTWPPLIPTLNLFNYF